MALYDLGIIGAGNMAEAIVRGVIRAGLLRPDQIVAADVAPARRQLFAEQLDVRAVESNGDAAKYARTLLLSVKPQHMADALAAVGAAMRPDALVVSIAAGTTTSFIEQRLGGRPGAPPVRVVRAMPNTPMLVGEGMTAVAPGAHATADDVKRARRIFESAGAVIDVEESLLDAVTALSGSGPAYFFYLAEHMIAAGTEMGLSPEHARLLVTRTALGAAKMLTESNEPPQELRRRVTSPGGTTEAAIRHMEGGRLPDVVKQAIFNAERRGKELRK
jgi:pyrroline-5-carboxylate reductase